MKSNHWQRELCAMSERFTLGCCRALLLSSAQAQQNILGVAVRRCDDSWMLGLHRQALTTETVCICLVVFWGDAMPFSKLQYWFNGISWGVAVPHCDLQHKLNGVFWGVAVPYCSDSWMTCLPSFKAGGPRSPAAPAWRDQDEAIALGFPRRVRRS